MNADPTAFVHSREWAKIMRGDPVEINPSIGNGLKIMTVDELKRAQLLWLAEPLNVAWNMHEIFAEGIDQVLRFFLERGWS